MKSRSTTRRSSLLAILAGIILALLAPGLPASADSASHPDSQDDVTYYDWDTDTYHEGDWDELDIHKVSIDAATDAVTVTTEIVALTEGWWKILQNAYDVTGDGAEDFRLNVFYDGTHHLRKVNGIADFGTVVSCGGVGISVDYANSRLMTKVPRSCMANTSSVGVSVTTFDSEDYDCDCNDAVMDNWPNQIGTYSPMIPYSNASTPPPPPATSYSPDSPEGTIYRLYRAYFLREPDQDGYDYWVGVYRNGYPLDKISNDFARSNEFQQTYGSVDNRQFLTLVYQNVLDRDPDQDGYDYWVDQMERGMLRGYVMIYFSDSEEFRSKTADGRPPGY